MTPRVGLALQSLIDPALADYGSRILWLDERLGSDLDSLEIGFFHEEAEPVAEAVRRPAVRAALGRKAGVSLHLASRSGGLDPAGLAASLDLARDLARNGLLDRLSLHLDMEPCFAAVQALDLPGVALLFENPDSRAERDFAWDGLAAALERHPRFNLLFDLAHAAENQPRGCDPRKIAQQGQGRIGQVHYSYPANLYDPALVGPGFATSHSLTCLLGREAAAYARTAAGLCPDVTIEGVVPPGEAGLDLLRQEIALVRNLFAR